MLKLLLVRGIKTENRRMADCLKLDKDNKRRFICYTLGIRRLVKIKEQQYQQANILLL